MSDTKTASMLQRVPAILAVTAASYGLPLEPRGERMRGAARNHKGAPHPQAARHGKAGGQH